MDLFVFDVDGTLSKDNSPLTERDKRCIDGLILHGNAVAVASGRPASGVKMVLDQLIESPYKFVISANGGEVFDGTGKRISYHCLRFSDYQHVYDSYHTKDRTIYLYKSNLLASYDKGKFIDMEYNWNHMEGFIDLNVHPLKDDDPITKIEIGSTEEESLNVEKEISEEDKKKYNVMRSGPTFIEYVHKSVDKKTGVTNIQSYLRLPKEHVHTFGDSMNDLLMIKEFDGTAMGNALPIIKRYAKRVTKNVEEDGIAYALENWFRSYWSD